MNPAPAPTPWSRFFRWLLESLGWSLIAEYPATNKYVLVVAPHTSNWDFPLGLAASWALQLDARWLGKHTLFRWPFGWFFRALGGVPVRRDRKLNLIEQIAQLFARSDRLIVALAPEGTRGKTNHWKSGFYHAARAAGVPIAMATLDYGRREIVLGGTFVPGSDIEDTFEEIRTFYRGRRGMRPENASDIQSRPQ